MGESLVETPKLENKMGDSVTHIPCLQESVSFGRFEHDSLCWERWSTFPTNKYLEEVEKCSTPGSVAQKKAYFEAHYKKIAARKAELLEEEKERESESVTEDKTSRDSVWDTSEEDLDVEKVSGENCTDKTELLNGIDDDNGEVSDKHIDIPIDVIIEEDEVENPTIEDGADVIDEVEDVDDDDDDVIDRVNQVEDRTVEVGECFDVLSEEDDVIEETKDIRTERIDEMNHGMDKMKEDKDVKREKEMANEDLDLKMDIPELPVEVVLVKEDATSHGVWQDKEVLPQRKIKEREMDEGETEKAVDLVDLTKMKKPTLVKKATYTANAKKKSTSPTPKKTGSLTPRRSPMISTPKSGKPEPKQTAKSTLRPGLKKETGYTPLTSKKGTKPETKRVLPTSLHMSLSYGPANSEPSSLTTMRKSLIMERMGDKDIVKRAFKAFQNPSVSSSWVEKPTSTHQSTTKRIEPRVSTPGSLKKKEGITKATKAISPSSGQQGMRKTPQSIGIKQSIGVDQRNDKAMSTSFGSRSVDNGRQQKQVGKMVELKTNTKDAVKSHLQSKLKTEKAGEIKPNPKLSSKSKLSASHGHGFLRGSVRKEDAKI